MELIKFIKTILAEQKHSFKPIPVDLILNNGNILLRSFRIYELDKKNNLLKGLTFKEEYVHSREYREPEFCFINLDEIKEAYCNQLDLHYEQVASKPDQQENK